MGYKIVSELRLITTWLSIYFLNVFSQLADKLEFFMCGNNAIGPEKHPFYRLTITTTL